MCHCSRPDSQCCHASYDDDSDPHALDIGHSWRWCESDVRSIRPSHCVVNLAYRSFRDPKSNISGDECMTAEADFAAWSDFRKCTVCALNYLVVYCCVQVLSLLCTCDIDYRSLFYGPLRPEIKPC
jgi:hypothetical protein